MTQSDGPSFPYSAGILFGLGLGGFFDGIVLHQILQWHHMLTSAGFPADSVHNLQLNTFWDGLFHAGTYAFVVAGLVMLWRRAHRRHLWWSTRLLIGTLLIGFGAFNLVEGTIDHHLLGLHHVNETVPREQWIYWDLAFLAWGAAMVVVGGWLVRKQRGQVPQAAGLPDARGLLAATAAARAAVDEQAPQITQAGENTCRHCAGRGLMDDGRRCMHCAGTGRIIETVGDA